ncbi:MAG: hypothetical protein WC340_15615 [Kiritimatiellia bacterium]
MAKVTITIEDHLSGAVFGHIDVAKAFDKKHATTAERVAVALFDSFEKQTIPDLKEHGLQVEMPVLQ